MNRRHGSTRGGLTHDTIVRWLAEQTEYDYRPKPGTTKVIHDPQVWGTFAVQFDDERQGITHLLFVTGHEDGPPEEVLERTLEEVEFSSWPPTSGNLQFF